MSKTSESSPPSSGWSDALHDELAAIVGEAHVLTSSPDRIAYARDCWPGFTIRARAGKAGGPLPAAVVQPASEEEVVELVKLAEREEIPIVPYGAGSGVCGGAVPEGPALTIDVKRLRHIDVDEDAMLARIGPGVIGQHLETRLLRRGLTLGHYPSSLYCSSVGGYLATRSAGQYSSRYGKIEDMVESIRFVTGGGEVVETAELARHGIDLLPLVIGSEGTFGVITDATMKLLHAPESRWYRGYMMPTTDTGTAAMRALMQAGLMPNVLRLYDEVDTLIGGKSGEGDERAAEPTGLFDRMLDRARDVLGHLVESDPVRGVIERTTRGLMGRILGAPLVLQQLSRLIPGGCMLVVGYEGEEEQVAVEAAATQDILSQFGEDVGAGPGEHWYEHRFSVSYKMSPLMDSGAFSDTMEVSTRWSNLMRLYTDVKAAMSPHVLTMAHFSHAYHDGCSIYFTFAGFEPELDSTLELYDRAWKAGLGAVAAAGASVAHHHGVGKSKAPWTAFDHPGGAPLMAGLRDAFDPAGIFNPGKVWPLPRDTEDRTDA